MRTSATEASCQKQCTDIVGVQVRFLLEIVLLVPATVSTCMYVIFPFQTVTYRVHFKPRSQNMVREVYHHIARLGWRAV